ncbi:MAG: hypothetical protein ACYDBT_11440 [Desulfobulbaceae bacterium]
MLDGYGPAWLALDTSIKVAGFSGNDPSDTVQTLNLAAIRDGYLATPIVQVVGTLLNLMNYYGNFVPSSITDGEDYAATGETGRTRDIASRYYSRN